MKFEIILSNLFGIYINQKLKISPKMFKTFDFQLLHEISSKCAFPTSKAVLSKYHSNGMVSTRVKQAYWSLHGYQYQYLYQN